MVDLRGYVKDGNQDTLSVVQMVDLKAAQWEFWKVATKEPCQVCSKVVEKDKYLAEQMAQMMVEKQDTKLAVMTEQKSVIWRAVLMDQWRDCQQEIQLGKKWAEMWDKLKGEQLAQRLARNSVDLRGWLKVSRVVVCQVYYLVVCQVESLDVVKAILQVGKRAVKQVAGYYLKKQFKTLIII